MRARDFNPQSAGARWLLALLAALSISASWAQDTEAPDPAARASAETADSAVPAPPAPPKAPDTDQEVRIFRGNDGSLHIRTRDENGERTEVQVDLGEEFGGALTKRIYKKLESKGILDEKGLVVEEALDSVPKNVDIGISADLELEGPRRHHHSGDGDDFPFEGSMTFMVPVIAILAVFGTPILIVWLVTRNSYRKKQLLMDNINRMVAEGRDIPPELLDAMEGESPRNMKDRGFTLIAVGLAISIWLNIAAGPEVGSLGLIPLFIGVARFLNWKLDNQSGNKAS